LPSTCSPLSLNAEYLPGFGVPTPAETHSAVHVLRAALSTYGWVTEPRCMRSAEGCAQGAARRSRFTTTHCCRLSDQPTDCQNAPTGRREACCAAWPLGTTGGCARRTVDLSGLRTCSICTASVARTHALWCRSTCGAVAQWRMERSVTCGACRVRPAYPRGLTTHGAGRVSHTAGRRRRTRASSRA
jgi:hypothetical protein